MVTKDAKKLIQKHGTLTPKQVKEKFRQMQEMKKTMTSNAAELEKNLVEFNKITDPMVDPESDKVLCWIRRPTTEELENLVPTELLEYQNHPDDVPTEVMNRHKDFQFKMMANLIENPKKTAKWWKKNANMVFQRLFQIHLRCVLDDLGVSAENF